MDYKKPDLNKPRRRYDKGMKEVPAKDSFSEYRSLYPDSSIDTGRKLHKVHMALVRKIRENVISHRDGVKMGPLGIFQVIAIKSKHPYIKIKESEAAGKKIMGVNLKTDFKVARTIFVRKYPFNINNGLIYKFYPVKEYYQAVSRNFITKFNDYVCVEEKEGLIEHCKGIKNADNK